MSKNHSGNKNQIRLQKYIADCGVTSRRKAEILMQEGKVEVNGQIVMELGTKVDPQEDLVVVDGKTIDLLTVDHIYLVMNKPRSCVTTVNDPQGRKTVMDFVPLKTRVYPVGRLDYLSEGLLILTNDGDLGNKILHPRFGVTKTYEVKVFGRVNEMILKKLRDGVHTSEGFLKPKSVRIIKYLQNKTWLEFRLQEGKNREIRRICEACGITIDKLRRVAIGNLSIEGIKPGQWEYINKSELLELIGINKDGSRRKDAQEFISTKKTLNKNKMVKFAKRSQAKLATAEEFSRYRKEEYYATLQLQKEARERMAAEKAKEEIAIIPSFHKGKESPSSRV
jgi:23S rRNA pseudouridine2605 synthase